MTSRELLEKRLKHAKNNLAKAEKFRDHRLNYPEIADEKIAYYTKQIEEIEKELAE